MLAESRLQCSLGYENLLVAYIVTYGGAYLV